MRTIYDIARAELKLMFYSPIAWLIIIIFLVQLSLRFTATFSGLVWSVSMGGTLPGGLTENLFVSPFGGLYPTVLSYLYLYIPLVTMGLISREYNNGTIRMLYASPVTNSQIILGKFLSMMFFGLVLVFIVGLFILFAAINVKDFDLAPTLTGLLGIYFLICVYSAVGIYMSSLTSYQVVAAISTLFILGFLNFVGGLWQHIDFVRDVTWWLSMSGRANELVNGLICSEDVIYFVMITCLFLSFAIIHLRARRQKMPWKKTWGQFVGVFLIVVAIGYITSRPSTMFFYDTTATKHNTLTKSSQEIIKQLKGDLKITTYVNVLDPDFGYLFPKDKNNDLKRFRQYTRFKPEMEFEYVYYYDKSPDPSIETRYPGMTDRERMISIAKTYREDTNRFLSPQEIRERVDLSAEKNRLTRVIERGNGQKTLLRTFNDVMKFPSESEISASLKHLVMKMPVIGFVTGHGERSYLGQGARDYSTFSDNRPYRHALINQGFDFAEVNLKQPIAEEVDILVLADVRQPLSSGEIQHFKDYIEKGGNVLVAGDVNRQETMNPLLNLLGFEFLKGQLVNPSKYHSPDLMLVRTTNASQELTPFFAAGLSVTMPGCLGIRAIADYGYQAIPLLETVGDQVWNEMQTTDFVDQQLTADISLDEIPQRCVTSYLLKKMTGGKEQKIILLGDADVFSNDELLRSRKGISAYNFTFIQQVFYCLSDGRAPIDTSRPEKTDNAIYLGEAGMSVAKALFVWVLPGILLLMSLFIWIRRRGR